MSDLRDVLGDDAGHADLHPHGRAARVPLRRTSRDEPRRTRAHRAAIRFRPRRRRIRRAVATAVAVLDFANVTEDPDIAWLRAGIAETVTSDLGRARSLPRHRSLARRPGRAAHGRLDARDGRRARRVAPGHGQLSARRAAPAHHGAARRSAPAARRSPTRRSTARSKTCSRCRTGSSRRSRASWTCRLRAPAAAGRARDLQPRGLPRLHRGLAQDREPRYRSRPGRHRRLHARDCARPALRDRVHRAGERGIRRLRDDAHGARPRTSPALASGIDHATHAAELDPRLAEAHATLSFLLVERRPLRRSANAPRTPPSRSSPTAGAINTASATRSGATRGCAPSSAR